MSLGEEGLRTKDAELSQPPPPLKKYMSGKPAHHKMTSVQVHRSLTVCAPWSCITRFMLQVTCLIFLSGLIWLQKKQMSLNVREWYKKRKQTVSLHLGETRGEELEGTLKIFYLNFSFCNCANWWPERDTPSCECLTLNILLILFDVFSAPHISIHTHIHTLLLKLFHLKIHLDKQVNLGS